MIVQIYAFTSVEQALQAVELGVDHIGFIAGNYGEVHAELTFEQAAEIVAALPAGVKSSALTMATEVPEIVRMANQVKPDIVHISTDTWAISPAAMSQLRSSLPPAIALMKAIAVADEDSLSAAQSFFSTADYLLLDTKVGGMPGVGATGQTHDWSISRRIVEQSPIPVILAGGLTPQNVGQAIRQVRPAGVDSNTGTNLPDDPVGKDMEKVAAFAQAAAAAGEAPA